MPLTNHVDRYRATVLGLDPDTLDDIPIHEEAVTPPKEEQNPVVKPTVKSTSLLNKAGSFLQENARNILPSITGLGATVIGSMTPLGPITGIPLGIAAGLLERKLQDAAVDTISESLDKPELKTSYYGSEEKNYAENPISSTLGAITSGGLLKPSIANLKPAGQGLRNIVTGVKPSLNEAQALIAAGASAAIPTALRAYNDPEVSHATLLTEALGGLLMNKETKLGVKSGLLHPTKIEPSLYNKRELQRAQKTEGTYKTSEIEALDRAYKAEVENDPIVLAKKKADEVAKADKQAEIDLIAEEKARKAAEFEANKQVEAEKKVEADERLKLLEQNQAELLKKQQELESAKRQEDFLKAKAEELKAEPPTLPKTEVRPKPIVTTETGKDIMPDYTGVQEADITENLSKPPTEAEQIQEKYDKGYYDQTSSEIAKGLKEQGMSNKVTKAIYDLFKKLGVRRNVKVDQDYNLIQDGKLIAGRQFIREGLNEAVVKINPDKAGVDTLPHELTHSMFEDILRNGTDKEKAKANKTLTKLTETEGFKQWKASLAPDSNYNKLPLNEQAHEYLAKITGEDTVRRILGTDKAGAFKNFYKDFLSNIKEKFNNASEEDYARIFSNRLINERPFSESYGGKSNVSSSVSQSSRNQEESSSGGEQKVSYTQEQSALNSETSDIPKIESTEAPKTEQLASVPRTREDFTAPIIRPEIEKIRKIEGDTGPKVADHFTSFLEDITLKRGQLVNQFDRGIRQLAKLNPLKNLSVKGALDYWHQDSKELANVRDWFWAKQDGNELPKLTEQETEIKDFIVKINKKVRDEVIARGKDKGGKLREVEGYNEEYLPNTIDREVLHELLQNPESTRSRDLKDAFVTYQKSKGFTEKEALDKFKKIIKGNSQQTINTAEQFGPIDKAAGVGLPKEWRSKNIIDVMDRYLDRVSRRLAYHDSIENVKDATEDIEKLLPNDSVKSVYNDITGNHAQLDDPKVKAALGIIRTGLLGTPTGALNLYNSLHIGAQHFDSPTLLKATANSIANLSDNLAEAWDSGRIRRHLSTLELGDGNDNVVSLMRRIRDVGADISGSNWFEQLGRAINTGQGRYATLDYLEKIKSGDKVAKKWFENFGDKGVDYTTKTDLTNEELNKIAGRYVDSAQGTYDARGLPRQVQEGMFSPFLNLTRWPIEKSNNFIKHVVNPATRGDFKPLIMSTLATVIGGAGAKELRELITKRKDRTASFAELEEGYKEGHNVVPDAFYKLAGLYSAAGQVGILGDIAKTTMDMAYGKNRPQAYNNILIEAAENTATLAGNLVKEISENGASMDLVTESLGKILEDNLQTYRMIMAHVSSNKQEDIDKSNKLRDLRVYNTISGNKIADLSSPFGISFDSSPAKRYKKTESLDEAVKILPELINRALERAGDDPEKFKKEMTKIKMNSYQTMPDPKKWPLSFTKYITFLNETQGQEEANKRVLDYITKKEVNRVKSSMVP